MALTTEQIEAEAFVRWGDMKGAPLAMCRGFARAIEAEVRKQDTELILQLVEALEKADKISGYPNNRKTINAGRARLDGKP